MCKLHLFLLGGFTFVLYITSLDTTTEEPAVASYPPAPACSCHPYLQSLAMR